MTPVTDDTELRILRVAYRRALGYEEDLSNENNEKGNELANDLAHELKKQTPDFNEFQDQISRSFEDGKHRYRNQKLKDLGQIAGLNGRSLSIWSLFGDPKFARQPLSRTSCSLTNMSWRDTMILSRKAIKLPLPPVGLKEQTYYEFLLGTMSVVNERIVLAEEKNQRREDDPSGYAGKFPFSTPTQSTQKNSGMNTINRSIWSRPCAAELRFVR